MKTLSVILILLSLTFKGLGQIDYLTPCTDLGDVIPEIKEYESDLFKVLLKGFNNKPVARYVVQPAFAPEYAFQIQLGLDDNYVLIANCLKTNLWGCKSRDTIEIEQFIIYIDQDLAGAFSMLFKKVLLPVDGPCIGGGQDGITYKLFTCDIEKGLICGETWSPAEGSKMYGLTSICEAALEYSKSPSLKDKAELLKQIMDYLFLLN